MGKYISERFIIYIIGLFIALCFFASYSNSSSHRFIASGGHVNLSKSVTDDELLLKDLSSRLPYGVIVNQNGIDGTLISIDVSSMTTTIIDSNGEKHISPIGCTKPYLRPTTSMTKEEVKTFVSNFYGDADGEYDAIRTNRRDWLLENHFDFRGLLIKKLALSEKSYDKN